MIVVIGDINSAGGVCCNPGWLIELCCCRVTVCVTHGTGPGKRCHDPVAVDSTNPLVRQISNVEIVLRIE
jgi:hypothetical protein